MDETYEMTIGLNVLEHLGINLYSNVAAVLTEAVANSWDADAAIVDIEIDSDNKWISITDDGIGMTINDMNKRYLTVGYRRRTDKYPYAIVTASGRPVMGRKGLGKLSLFSIANQIELRTVHNGDAHGCRMTTAAIRVAADSNKRYHPIPIPPGQIDLLKGTQIQLSEIRRDRLATTATALRKRLALRFSVIGESHGFIVRINGDPITIADRDNLSKAQFLWLLGDSGLQSSAIDRVSKHARLSTRDDAWEENWEVRGWIATAHKPKDLDIQDVGNLNSIVLLARGRLIHENILEKLNDGRWYTKYLTGQLEVDFLDLNDADDIATSDRQRLQEYDPRYSSLISFLWATLAKVERQWNEWRPSKELEKTIAEIPAVAQWLDTLGRGHRPSAELLIGKIRALPLDDEEHRKELYRHGILAFERLRIFGLSSDLAEHLQDPVELLRILGDSDSLEASLYLDIVRSRLSALKAMQKLIDDEARERVLHEYLFDHLWILDPAWERATRSESMEHRLVQKKVFGDGEEKSRLLGRVDIKYRTTAGKHIIIELKRANRKINLVDLEEQGRRYVDGLRAVLLDMNVRHPDIEVIFVIGKPLDEEASNPDRLRLAMDAISRGSRVIHYDTLMLKAEQMYQEFLDRSSSFDTVTRIVDQI